MGISQTRAENVITLFLLLSCRDHIYIFIHLNCLCLGAVTLSQPEFSGKGGEKKSESEEDIAEDRVTRSGIKFCSKVDLN